MEDPDYFWLDPQVAVEDIQCDVTTDTLGFDTLLITTPVVMDSTLLVINSQGDSLYYTIEVPTGEIDSTTVVTPIVSTTEVCDTVYIHAADVLYNIPERIRVQDPYTDVRLGIEWWSGVWMTRDALNFNTTPTWIESQMLQQASPEPRPSNLWRKETKRVTSCSILDGMVKSRASLDCETCTLRTMSISRNHQHPKRCWSCCHRIECGSKRPQPRGGHRGWVSNSSAGKVRETFNALSDNVTWNNIWVLRVSTTCRVMTWSLTPMTRWRVHRGWNGLAFLSRTMGETAGPSATLAWEWPGWHHYPCLRFEATIPRFILGATSQWWSHLCRHARPWNFREWHCFRC